MVTTTTILARFLVISIILVLLDLYIFKGIKAAAAHIASNKVKRLIYWTFWLVSLGFIAASFHALFTLNRHEGPHGWYYQGLVAVMVLLVIPKLILAAFLLIEDVFRLIRFLVVGFDRLFTHQMEGVKFFEGRRQFISQLGLFVVGMPFFSILHGITKGKYNYKVHRVELFFKDLPPAFDGFSITQLSDIHSGSFDDKLAVEKGIQLANDLNADLIVFTGDLVNNKSEEIIPWIDSFKKLAAPYGKYSILGNHDYGDYVEWPSAAAKQQDLDALKLHHGSMGFRLLLNDAVNIYKNGESISLIGVENWGKPPFPQYGDLNVAMSKASMNPFKILLSHDPNHWEEKVIGHQETIQLTLSGHTHGMQFGIEVPGIKWSPVKYRYPRWAGLYQEAKSFLYVNRGFGFIGFPGRVGIWPEITKITLRKQFS